LETDSFEEGISMRIRGMRIYELSNHLGNVLTTISDRKIPTDSNTNDVVDYFVADILTASDYYPFGMQLTNRTYSVGEYRFGFQEQEKDDEIKGSGNSINFKYRMHDPRLGRFFAVDPLFAKYPYNSTYAFSENSTIAYIELEGLEKLHFIKYCQKKRTVMIIDLALYKDIDHLIRFAEYKGFKLDESWFEGDLQENEYWRIEKRMDMYTQNWTGTYISKYPSEASYKNGYGESFFDDVARTFPQWLAAKDQSLEGDVKEGLKLMGATVGLILSGGGLAIGGFSTTSVVLFAVNGAVTLDEISAIGNEDTFLEGIARDLGDVNAVRGLQVAKITLGIFNSTKGTIDIAISLENGNTVNAIYDAVNKVWVQTNTVISTTQVEKDEENK
jgi:RHS repeat-associated protein